MEHCRGSECEGWKGEGVCICHCDNCVAAVDEEDQAEMLEAGEEGCPYCGRVLLRSVEGKFQEPVYVRIWCDKCDYQRTEH